MDKQNLTISLPKDLIKKAKALALEEDLSLNALIRESIELKLKHDTGYIKAQEAELKRMERGLHMGTKGRLRINRDTLHEK